MKRIWALLIAVICLMGMAGCGNPLQEAENSDTPTIEPAAEATSSVTAEPTPAAVPEATGAKTTQQASLPTPGATVDKTAAAAPALPEGLAVICDENGGVCGGYYKGKWRTDSEIARYLESPAAFYSYNLLGEGETVVSEGVSYSDSDDESVSSWAKDNPDEGSGLYGLEVDDSWSGDADSYTGNPLEYYFLYSLGSECMPDIYAVRDSSEVKSAVQGMLNKQFGNDAPEAEIIMAVSADIDSDGKQETVINAANDEENVYEYYCDKPLYCISCIIEDDGEIIVIDEYYMSPETAINDYNKYASENEDESYKQGDDVAFIIDSPFFYVQNIIDLDDDGVCEFVMSWEAWEAWFTEVYKYKDKKLDAVLNYGGGV